MDEHLIEAILLDDGGRKHTRQEIFAYFQANRDMTSRTEFLKNSYNDIWVEVLAGADKVRVGYHAQQDGLLMWEGSYLSRTSESVFSWGVVTEMTEGLIERGEYKIKLGLQNAPVMAEQLSFFDMGGGAAVYEVPEPQRTGDLFPTRPVPQAVIDQALYTAGNSRGSAERIAVFYMRQRPEAECTAFLRREFGTENGRGIEYDGQKYAVWFMEDGIHLAQGDSIRTGHSRATVTWEQASARILELLEAGTYLSAAELEQAQDKVLLEMGDALLMTARDLTEEGRAQGLFPQTLAIHDQHKGYPELDEDMVAFAKSEGGLAALAEEYHAFLSAYEQDHSIMRFRLSEYCTHRIGTALDGLNYPERSFTAQPDFLRRCKMFITQDEIDRFFLADAVDSRLAVYAFFCHPHTKEEQQKFIKSRFGEYSGGKTDGYDYTKTYKGLTYQRKYAGKQYGEVKLTIPNVVKEYERLIAQKRFPSEDAIAAIPQYERKQLARSVYFGFSDAPDDVPRPYSKGADYYDAVLAIETQLTDQAKAVEMLEALTAYLEGMDEGDRHYDSVQRAKEQLSEYANGTFSLFNHRHDHELSEPEQKVSLTEGPAPAAEPAQEQEAPPPEELAQAVIPPAFTMPRRKERLEADTPLSDGGVNYRITDDALGAAPPSQRYANNVAAIRLLKQLEAENRPATTEEQEVLAKYVGWGGLADCFDPKNSRYEELKGLLSETEYAAARESTLTAFYTPPVVIRSIYTTLGQMGFRQGNVLEPACGIGHFLGMLQENMAESKLYGVELDDISGRIARQLYPRSSISVRGYEKMNFPDNFFDVAVGNVPFGQFKVQDRRYDRLNLSIHEYFFAKTLDKVRPGGVVVFITSSYTMDKRTGNVRKYIAQRAELLGAIRLPNDTFKAAAGTEVVSDILFLQKRDRMVDIEPEWVQLGTNDDGISIQRYLQMDALQEQGFQHFDAWAANYGETVTTIELAPEGTGYRAKTCFAKFNNLPELISVFKNVADIQTADMLNLPVPEAHYHNIALKPSEYQKEMVASLAERAEQVRNRQVDSSVDNMLLITNDGRKLALDQRLINPMLPSDPEGKAAKCAETVFDIWQRTAEKRSTQMIFCDLSTPGNKRLIEMVQNENGTYEMAAFQNVYEDIRAKLIHMGIPDNEIAYIHDAKTETQKKDLFTKVRAGQVRVLLGSTQRMGAGTNCQQKLVALHHLDCPWRPSDLQQREGRIIRQGNENSEVDIYSYVTEGTFDAYLYQLVERKQKFIAQIMTSKSPVRSAEDVDEQALSYAEIKALASGNPLIKEKMDLDIEVTKLKLLKSSHLSQRYALEDAISKTFPKSLTETQERLTGYSADIATVKEHTTPNADGFSPMTLAGKVYAEKKAAGAELLAMCQNMLTPEPTQVGSYRGLTLELSFDSFSQEYRLTMIGQLRHMTTLGTDVFGNIQRMDNLLETLPVKEQACKEKLSELHTQLETAKVEVLKPFPREEELKAKLARLEELNALLNMDKHDPEVIADTGVPEAGEQPPARKKPQWER